MVLIYNFDHNNVTSMIVILYRKSVWQLVTLHCRCYYLLVIYLHLINTWLPNCSHENTNCDFLFKNQNDSKTSHALPGRGGKEDASDSKYQWEHNCGQFMTILPYFWPAKVNLLYWITVMTFGDGH